MVLIHYCYCGHPRMPSEGEITENCRDLQIPKNQDFPKKNKQKAYCTIFQEDNSAIYKDKP